MSEIRWGTYVTKRESMTYLVKFSRVSLTASELESLGPVYKERWDAVTQGFVARSTEETEQIARGRGATIIAEPKSQRGRLRGIYLLFREVRRE